MKSKMRKLLTVGVLVIAAATTACNGASGNRKTKTINENSEMKTIQLTMADFTTKVADIKNSDGKWTYLGDKPAIVDFYADWCGPCKMIAPVLDELAKEYDGQIYVYKVNTENEPELASAFGIRSIPSLLFIPMGEDPQMARGAMPKESFKQLIDEVLLGKKPADGE